jgi:hypothetical protein
MTLKALAAKINADLAQAVRLVGAELLAHTQQVNDDARIWPAFAKRTTVRRNPLAPMPIVGAYRDNIDFGEASRSLDVDNSQPLLSAVEFEGLDQTKLNEMLRDKPILEVSYNEFDFDKSFKEALKWPS